MDKSKMVIEDCIAFLTNKASKTISDNLEQRLSVYGVTRVQWIAMYFIDKNELDSQKELAEIIGIKESTLTSLLDRMEREGLITKESDDCDRRKKLVVLTDKGREVKTKLTVVAEKFKNDATRNLSQEQVESFQKILDIMVNSVKETK